MSFNDLTKEQQIMVSLRKVLSNIIKEITPQKGASYPLSKQTVEDIRMSLALITAREQELAKEQGINNLDRPYYSDEPSQTVPLHYSKKIH